MKAESNAARPLVAALVCALAVATAHGQTAETPLQFERGFPVAGTAESSYDASDLRRAIEAYKFFYPTMGTEAVMQQILAAGAKVNEVGIVMATSPRQQFGGANAYTPYAMIKGTTKTLELNMKFSFSHSLYIILLTCLLGLLPISANAQESERVHDNRRAPVQVI